MQAGEQEDRMIVLAGHAAGDGWFRYSTQSVYNEQHCGLLCYSWLARRGARPASAL